MCSFRNGSVLWVLSASDFGLRRLGSWQLERPSERMGSWRVQWIERSWRARPRYAKLRNWRKYPKMCVVTIEIRMCRVNYIFFRLFRLLFCTFHARCKHEDNNQKFLKLHRRTHNLFPVNNWGYRDTSGTPGTSHFAHRRLACEANKRGEWWWVARVSRIRE